MFFTSYSYKRDKAVIIILSTTSIRCLQLYRYLYCSIGGGGLSQGLDQYTQGLDQCSQVHELSQGLQLSQDPEWMRKTQLWFDY